MVHKEWTETEDIPFSAELDFWVTITFLVDADVVCTSAAARGADVDLFPRISSIFPSGA